MHAAIAEQPRSPSLEPSADVDSDEAVVEGSPTQPMPVDPDGPHGLIVSPTPERRLYWRAKLALNGVRHVAVADDFDAVQDALSVQRFRVALVDLDGWPREDALQLVRKLSGAGARVGRILALSQSRDLATRASAWFAGASSTMQSPPDPQRFQQFVRGLAELSH